MPSALPKSKSQVLTGTSRPLFAFELEKQELQERLECLDLQEKSVVELQVQKLRNELARKEAKLPQQKQDLLTHARSADTCKHQHN